MVSEENGPIKPASKTEFKRKIGGGLSSNSNLQYGLGNGGKVMKKFMTLRHVVSADVHMGRQG